MTGFEAISLQQFNTSMPKKHTVEQNAKKNDLNLRPFPFKFKLKTKDFYFGYKSIFRSRIVKEN
jgi:hypothetical protein